MYSRKITHNTPHFGVRSYGKTQLSFALHGKVLKQTSRIHRLDFNPQATTSWCDR